MITRRLFTYGGGGLAAAAIPSYMHQAWLSHRSTAQRSAQPLRAIPIFDARQVGLVGFAHERKEQMRELRDACIGPLTPALQLGFAGIDRLAAGWLRQTRSPYASEIDEVARIAGFSGVHALNTSYEWGCTTLAGPAPGGGSARLLRTLDWPYHGLGRLVELVRQRGEAGDFWSLTWPGALGTLTAIAPGRFAAALNQAPQERPIDGWDFLGLDAIANTWTTYFGAAAMPPLHLLRRTFETARDFATARKMLETTELTTATIFTLAGLEAGDTCVIERTRTAFQTKTGLASAANIWRYSTFPGAWAGREGDDDPRGDSLERAAKIEAFAGRAAESFEWVTPPVRNGLTRLAVEAIPGTGRLRAVGYEQDPANEEDAVPATLVLDMVLD